MKQYKPTEETVHQVNELFTAYNIAPSFGFFFNNSLKISELIQNGLSFEFFKKLSKQFPFSEDEWADFLNISTKSLQRYRTEKDFLFKPIYSEKIIEITEVSYLGMEVFGDVDKFKTWLKTDNFALGNHSPQDLLRNSYGKDLVINELNRLQHGIFS